MNQENKLSSVLNRRFDRDQRALRLHNDNKSGRQVSLKGRQEAARERKRAPLHRRALNSLQDVTLIRCVRIHDDRRKWSMC